MEALLFIVRTLLELLVIVFLLRFLLPLVRADIRNPLSQAVIKLTDPLIIPLRRLLPPMGKIDTAALFAVLLVQIATAAIILFLNGFGFNSPVIVLKMACEQLALTVLQFYFVAILIYALLSWVAPSAYSPVANVLTSLCDPILRPVRRLIPPIAGLDLSVLFVLIGLQALIILIR